MVSHKDKFRSHVPDKAYRDNHAAIFGKPKGSKGLNTAKQAELRQDHHNKQAEDGKKPADWYLNNERRVPADPDYVKKPGLSKSYDKGHAHIFGDK